MKKTQITLRIPREVYEALERMGRDSGLNISCLIKSILYYNYLKKK